MNVDSKRMAGTFQSVDLFILSCLFLSVESQTGQILPPQNVSVLWLSDFEPQLSWAPPQHSVESCSYRASSELLELYSEITHEIQTSPWKIPYIVMQGGFLKVSVETVCNGVYSKPVVINVSYPDLVRNLECSIQSSKQSHCSWIPASHAPDLRFFYRLEDEDLTKSAYDNSPLSLLQECSSYNYNGDVRTGCNLQATVNQAIHILFNGTVNNMPARNTFKIEFIENVRPPPLNWTVTKTGDIFNITWIPPDIADLSWIFVINYTECNILKYKTEHETPTSSQLPLVSHCLYCMAIKAEAIGTHMPWSDKKCFDADTNPNLLVYAAIIIPLMFAGLAALSFVCCRKNRENIFPRIPEPRDLLSDISDNNNKITVCNLYVPQEEEDNCKITLIDPQSNHICKH